MIMCATLNRLHESQLTMSTAQLLKPNLRMISKGLGGPLYYQLVGRPIITNCNTVTVTAPVDSIPIQVRGVTNPIFPFPNCYDIFVRSRRTPFYKQKSFFDFFQFCELHLTNLSVLNLKFKFVFFHHVRISNARSIFLAKKAIFRHYMDFME